MVRNAAHDSVCACSHDEVVDAVHHRYAEARQIGDALRAQGLRLVGAALAGDEQVAVNTLARTRGGLVRVTRPGHRPEPGEQLLAATPPLTLLHTLPADGRARGAGVRARRPPADPRGGLRRRGRRRARAAPADRPHRSGSLPGAAERGPHALPGRGGAGPRRAHPGGRRRAPRRPGAGRRASPATGGLRSRPRRSRPSRRRTGASPTAWPASRSTPRPGPSRSTGTQASAGWSTTATRATPTTTARRTMTSSSTGRRPWSCGWASRDRFEPAWSSTPATDCRSGSTTPRPRGSAAATSPCRPCSSCGPASASCG